MNKYIVSLLYVSKKSGSCSCSAKAWYGVQVTVPLASGQGSELLYIKGSGEASRDINEAQLFPSSREMKEFAHKVADLYRDRDHNVYLLSHENAVFKI